MFIGLCVGSLIALCTKAHRKYLFLEQVDGDVKAQEKSTSVVLNWREVFDPWTLSCYLKINPHVNVLSSIPSGEHEPISSIGLSGLTPWIETEKVDTLVTDGGDKWPSHVESESFPRHFGKWRSTD